MAKPVRLRELAAVDVDEALDDYLVEAGSVAAGRFVVALERAGELLGSQPAIGSLRFSYELAIPELRSWRIVGFPYLIFYVEMPDIVDVWRVLHARRDVPAWLDKPVDDAD